MGLEKRKEITLCLIFVLPTIKFPWWISEQNGLLNHLMARPQRDSSGQGVPSGISKEALLQPAVPRGVPPGSGLLLNDNNSGDDIPGKLCLDIKTTTKPQPTIGSHPVLLGASPLVMILGLPPYFGWKLKGVSKMLFQSLIIAAHRGNSENSLPLINLEVLLTCVCSRRELWF